MHYLFKFLALGGTASTIGLSVHLSNLEPEQKYTVSRFANLGERKIIDVRDLPRTDLLEVKSKVKINYDRGGQGDVYRWDWF